MNAIAKQVIASLIVAGIVANATFLYQFGERLTRIETTLQALTVNHIAVK